MHVFAVFVARVRFVLARRPWLYWIATAALGAVTVLGVRHQMVTLDRAAAAWGQTRRVLVANRTLAPGEAPAATATELPLAVIPPGALTELPDDARLRQYVGRGEVIVELDVTARPGPAAGADAGTIVVAVSDPTASTVRAGTPVAIAADGEIIARHATITSGVDGVVFVAVDEQVAARVAEATLEGRASVLFLP